MDSGGTEDGSTPAASITNSSPDFSSTSKTGIHESAKRRHRRRRKQKESGFALLRHNYLIKFIAFCRDVSRMWLSNIIIFLLFILFGVVGAFVFKQIEEAENLDSRNQAEDKLNALIKEFFRLTRNRSIDDVIWRHDLAERMKDMSDEICQSGIIDEVINNNVKTVWTIENAIYFCVCVFTTIGYGDFVPKTGVGKVVTIIYAFFGIPFWLTLVGKFGNQMNHYVKEGMYFTNRWFYGDIKKDEEDDVEKGENKKTQNGDSDDKASEKTVVLGERKGVSAHLYAASFDRQIKLLTTAQGSRPSSYDVFYEQVRATDKKQLEKDRTEFRIPIKIPLLLMVIYIIAGALALTFIEDWNYLDSIYYLFITLLTVGFGDITPDKTPKLIFCCYVLIGMALFSFFFAVTFDSVENVMTKIKEAMENQVRKLRNYVRNLGWSAVTAIEKETRTLAFQPGELWKQMHVGMSREERPEHRRRKSSRPRSKWGRRLKTA